MTIREVAEKLSLPYRTLANWIETGLVVPEGYRKRQRCEVDLSDKDVHELSVVAQLREVVSMQAIRESRKMLVAMGHNPFSSGEFVVVAGTSKENRVIVKFCGEGEAVELIGRGRGQLFLRLAEPEP